ncbi:MAG: hypothetical protein ACP5I3_11685 [Thermoproteus sp.]
MEGEVHAGPHEEEKSGGTTDDLDDILQRLRSRLNEVKSGCPDIVDVKCVPKIEALIAEHKRAISEISARLAKCRGKECKEMMAIRRELLKYASELERFEMLLLAFLAVAGGR